jgi:hypothetical protein
MPVRLPVESLQHDPVIFKTGLGQQRGGAGKETQE